MTNNKIGLVAIYQGPSHEGDGIAVNSDGIPISPEHSQIEVEGDEVVTTFEDETGQKVTYVFSNRLKI